MNLGPVMIDVAGLRVAADEKERLRHPLVGGVILFARNYESPAQLRALTDELRTLREPRLLIAVDHEGGRVQRFRDGFTRIPPMRAIGQCRGGDARQAAAFARAAGTIIAAELQAHGIDFTFAPVVDVDFGSSSVIGDRAFSDTPDAVAELAGAFIEGLSAGGMAAVAKHFPGHGYARADSHFEIPVDERALGEIEASDLVPYRTLIGKGLGGVMPAHVVYPKVDARAAGFSPVWLKTILRGRLGFRGMIFSDDLSMEAAGAAGGIVERARAALDAGCDMVLLCNAPESVDRLLNGLGAAWLAPGLAEDMRGRRLLQAPSTHGAYPAAVDLLRSAVPDAART